MTKKYIVDFKLKTGRVDWVGVYASDEQDARANFYRIAKDQDELYGGGFWENVEILKITERG